MEPDPTAKDPAGTDDELVHVENESDVEVNDVTTDKRTVAPTPSPATRSELGKCPEKPQKSCDDATCARNHAKVPRNSCSASRLSKEKRKHGCRSDGGRDGRVATLKNTQRTEHADEETPSSKTDRRRRSEGSDGCSDDTPTAVVSEAERRKVIMTGHAQSLSQALSNIQDLGHKYPEDLRHKDPEDLRHKESEDCQPENTSISTRNLPRIHSPHGGNSTLRQTSPRLTVSSDFYHNSAFSRQSLASSEFGHLMPQSQRDLPPRPSQYLPPAPALVPEKLPHGLSTPTAHSLPECQRFLQEMGQYPPLLSHAGNSKDMLDKGPASSVSEGLPQPAHRPSFMIADILGDKQPSKEVSSKEPLSREPSSREAPSAPRSSLTYFPAVRYGPLRLLSPHSPCLDRSPESEDAPSCSQSPMEEEEEGSDIDVDSEYQEKKSTCIFYCFLFH